MAGKRLGSSFFSTSLATGVPTGVGNADFSNTATGTYTDGEGVSWKYITFTASGTLTVDKAGLADILVVGGGASAGTDNNNGSGAAGGGGGAGGHLYVTDAYLEAGSLTVVVGAGGSTQGRGADAGRTGGASRLGSYYAPSGGPGGSYGGYTGLAGGSGGGGGPSAGSGGAGTSGIGNNGGPASGVGPVGVPGGGGGAGGAGTNGTAGAGLANSITGSSVTRAVGGAVSGGATGAANTGNGGAGLANGAGASGGSGVVIVRVKV